MDKEDMDEGNWTIAYVGTRFIELICIAAFIFGFLWEGTEIFNLTLPQFLMLYGAIGAILSEIIARILSKKKPIKKKEGTKRG